MGMTGGSDIQKETHRRQTAETALASSQELFRLLVDAVEDYAIFALDPNGVILTWNLGAARLKGYTPEEIIGSHFSRFYTEPDLARNHPKFELEEAVRNGKYEEEGWRIRKDGRKFWANIIITALKDQQGHLRGFVKVTRDLTERKKAEDQLRDANANLEARIEERTKELSAAKASAERAVKARDEFFSIASHELKTPLASLKLQAQMRKRKVLKGNFSDFTPDKIVDLCEGDERQVARLTFLVENMLDISKLTSGNFSLVTEDFDMVELVRDITKSLEYSMSQSGNECTVESPAKVMGRWDRHRVEQVVSNLLTNASKYAAGKPVEVVLSAEENEVTIRVTDHGRGIAPINQKRVFVPFERVLDDKEVSGLGLGLYICRQICEAHGGSVELESELGKGSSFIVRLPRIVNLASGE